MKMDDCLKETGSKGLRKIGKNIGKSERRRIKSRSWEKHERKIRKRFKRFKKIIKEGNIEKNRKKKRITILKEKCFHKKKNTWKM